MNIGFSIYGALTAIAAVATFWHARSKRFEQHRAWAIRLFALVIGSWLYRMDYGFWHLLGHNMGHTPTFDGGFDVVMAFFFYIPNLIVAEAFIRARQLRSPASLPTLLGEKTGGRYAAGLLLQLPAAGSRLRFRREFP